VPRQCSVCTHPKRDEINRAIVAGKLSLRRIAKQYGLSPSAVERHAGAHIPATLAKAREAGEVASADDLLAQVRKLKDKALSILETAEAGGELRTALSGIKEARGCLELQAKMLCEIDRREREQPSGRIEVVDKQAHEILVIERNPIEQQEFERVIGRIRETAEEAGLALPEG